MTIWNSLVWQKSKNWNFCRTVLCITVYIMCGEKTQHYHHTFTAKLSHNIKSKPIYHSFKLSLSAVIPDSLHWSALHLLGFSWCDLSFLLNQYFFLLKERVYQEPFSIFILHFLFQSDLQNMIVLKHTFYQSNQRQKSFKQDKIR